ncbi:MAG: hypothetical protein JXB30_10070 [Anaerolineae bacterium]|nr:hypothetical protein [Anaerolineae bacterium]
MATNIGYFLDVSGTEHTHTALTVRLSEDTRDLGISYQAPSPTWRVSYRLVGVEHGQARLLAWGLFDNSLDEDLDDVQLTLISGRPISFEYALYESKVPHRPHVADLAEAVSAAANPLAAESIATISHELRTPLNSILGFSRVLLQGVDGELTAQQHQDIETIHKSGQHLLEQINNLLSAVHLKDDMSMAQPMLFRSGPLGDLKVSSSYLQPMIMENAEPEFLVYEVHTPITVRRGQSAMVPLIDTTTAYEEQRVYNGSKMPNHPLIVWRFANTTGVALEQGPVTISREGQYLGDSLIRFTGVNDEIQVPFALEFGILVTMDTRQNDRREYFDVKLDAHKRQIQVKEYRRTDYIYTLTSRISEDMTILIERRNPSRGEFDAMPEPVYDAQEHTRWPVVVPANASTVFTVRERDITIWTGDVLQQPPETIEALHGAGLLTEAAYGILHRLMGLMAQAKQDADESKELQAEYGQIISRQEQLRQNLRALGNSKREIGIRERILDDLEASENRRREIEGVLSEINRVGKECAEERETLLDRLFGESFTVD